MFNKKFGSVAKGVAVTSVLALGLTACGGRGASSSSEGGDNSGALVGIAMPTKTAQRWIQDGDNVKKKLEDMGYKTDLQYADDKSAQQASQIENMITKGAKALIIAAVDGTALSNVLKTAKEKGVKVLAYDRLINGTDAVDYYTTFDNQKVGQTQGKELLKGLGLTDEAGNKKADATPKNIELFAGSPDDNNATFFWNGAMEVLKPYMEDGTLKVVSGQTEFTQAAIQQWEPAKAQKRMEDLLSKYQGGTKLDGVLSPADILTTGIVQALTTQGFKVGETWPIVTGQDADKANLAFIRDGKQYVTIFKDTRKLADQGVKMIDQMLKGEKVEVNDEETYNNKVKVVPSYLLDFTVINKDNYEKELIESGYYKKEDIK